MSKARDLADIASDDVIATTATGVNVTGTVTAGDITSTGNLSSSKAAGYGTVEVGGPSGGLIDLKAPFSDDYDARIIYNSGTDLQINTLAAGEPILLRQGNTTKLSTTSTGIDVTGTVTADGLTVNSGGDQEVYFGDDFDGIALANIGANSSVEFGNSQGAGAVGRLEYARSSGKLTYSNGSNGSEVTRLAVASNGDISFFEDFGVTPKFFWDSSAESLGIGTTVTNGAKLTMESGQDNPSITGTMATGHFVAQSSSGGPALNVGSDGDGTWYNSAYSNNAGVARNHRWLVGGSEAMQIDASGNVGIGTATPASIVGGTDVSPVLSIGGADNTLTSGDKAGSVSFITNDGSYATTFPDGVTGEIASISETGVGGAYGMAFYTGTTSGSDRGERLRIDASGNVGIGESAPDTPLHIKNTSTYLKLEDSDGVLAGSMSAGVRMYAGASEHGQLGFIGTGSGIMLLRNAQGNLYIDADSNNAHTSSFIRFAVDNSEAMRIDDSGNVLVGKTSASGSNTVGFEMNAANYLIATRDGGASLILNRKTSNGDISVFQKEGVSVGTISVTASATAYNTSSDYRLKENITPVQGAADIVKAMQPVTYTFKSDGSWHDGFLAHELQELHPRAVVGEKDAMKDEEYEVTPAVEATYDDEGVELTPAVPAVMGTRSVPDYQGVDYSKLTPILTAALQEALNKIDALEARLTALEA